MVTNYVMQYHSLPNLKLHAEVLKWATHYWCVQVSLK